ncbi:MAG: 3-dehydroquinate synthase [Syntrophomonadaceae bacterium]|nr:3-dehydroquinate synthase [Syntrophomonadaceae bacterium]
MFEGKPEPQCLEVELGPRSYPVYIRAGCLKHLGKLIIQAGLGPKGLLVTNTTVADYYATLTQSSLEQAGLQVRSVAIPDGEAYKNLEWASRLYDAALEAQLDRRSPVIALGGGVIGDLAGFVAATYLRGVPLVQVPTTLLAQVDSSVGGKVAVNHIQGKNLIGSFYQPSLVVIDPHILKTLPARELIAGLAEVIKYGVIWDAEFFAFLEEKVEKALVLSMEVIEPIIARCCAIKAEIVKLDEREEGIRTLLNFGHTVGHAVETLTHYQVYRHGEAVALGMLAAGWIALELGRWSLSEFQRLRELLQRTGLPLHVPGADPRKLQELMVHDKKNLQGALRWVLPRSLGQAEINRQVPEELVRRALEKLVS